MRVYPFQIEVTQKKAGEKITMQSASQKYNLCISDDPGSVTLSKYYFMHGVSQYQ